MKIEIISSNTSKNLPALLDRAVAALPAEHLVGLEKIVVVDNVTEPRLSAAQRSTLPALYHPKMPGQRAWAEIAMGVIAPRKKFPKNLVSFQSAKLITIAPPHTRARMLMTVPHEPSLNQASRWGQPRWRATRTPTLHMT